MRIDCVSPTPASENPEISVVEAPADSAVDPAIPASFFARRRGKLVTQLSCAYCTQNLSIKTDMVFLDRFPDHREPNRDRCVLDQGNLLAPDEESARPGKWEIGLGCILGTFFRSGRGGGQTGGLQRGRRGGFVRGVVACVCMCRATPWRGYRVGILVSVVCGEWES